MGRREQMTIGELTITKGIKTGVAGMIRKMVRAYAGVPATIVANRYFTGAMANGLYAILNSGLPGDGLAHNITVAATTDTGADTPGSILFTGLDLNGKIISESIIPAQGSTVSGLKAFKKVTAMLQSGWALVGGNDTIVIGFGEVVGLPDRLSATTDVLLFGFTTALVDAPTVVIGDELCENTVLVPTGNGAKKLTVIYQS
jgi:hypothetical protein